LTFRTRSADVTLTSRSSIETPASFASRRMRIFTSPSVASSRKLRGSSVSSMTLRTWNHW